MGRSRVCERDCSDRSLNLTLTVIVRGRRGGAAQHGRHRIGHAQDVAFQLVAVDEILAEGLLVPDRLVGTVGVDRDRGPHRGPAQRDGCRSPCPAGARRCRVAARPGRPPSARPGRAGAWPWPGRRPTVPRRRGRGGRRSRLPVRPGTRPGPGSSPALLARGLAAREASLAIILERPIPTAQSRWSSSCTRRRRPEAMSTGGPSSRTAPATSMKASSRPMGSTIGVTSARTLCSSAAHLGVAAVAPRQEDGLRAELARPDGRHGRVHPEGACLRRCTTRPRLVRLRRRRSRASRPGRGRRAPRPTRRTRPCRRGESSAATVAQPPRVSRRNPSA